MKHHPGLIKYTPHYLQTPNSSKQNFLLRYWTGFILLDCVHVMHGSHVCTDVVILMIFFSLHHLSCCSEALWVDWRQGSPDNNHVRMWGHIVHLTPVVGEVMRWWHSEWWVWRVVERREWWWWWRVGECIKWMLFRFLTIQIIKSEL